MRAVKKILFYILPLTIFAAGAGLIAYPTVSDWWNTVNQDRAILSYTETVSGLSEAEYDEFYRQAVEYNALSAERGNPYLTTDEEKSLYGRLLNIDGSGIMGYIYIPALGCTIPIYHGTEEATLQTAVGHLEWTSLPVGGPGTHCVLSGHRGLPGARLFTDIDKLVIGDTFQLFILDEVLTYEVDQIVVVLPDETEELRPAAGEDYCTLVTCTPYGINTHRILCRGHRIETPEEAAQERITRVSAEGAEEPRTLYLPVVAAVTVLAAGNLALWLVRSRRIRLRDAKAEAALDAEIERLRERERNEGRQDAGPEEK